MSKKRTPLRAAVAEMGAISRCCEIADAFHRDWRTRADVRGDVTAAAQRAVQATGHLDGASQVAALLLAVSVCRGFVQHRAEIEPPPDPAEGAAPRE